MQFIKLDTHPWINWRDDFRDELKKRRLDQEDEAKVIEQMEAELEK